MVVWLALAFGSGSASSDRFCPSVYTNHHRCGHRAWVGTVGAQLLRTQREIIKRLEINK